MKIKKTTAFFITLFIALFCLTSFLFKQVQNKKIERRLSSNFIAINESQRTSYRDSVKAIHSSWEKIREGNSYFQLEDYIRAAAYEQAYSLGEKAVGGIKLATTYEKMGEYDKAISLLKNMINKGQLSESGIQMARSMISRMETS